MYGNRGTTDPGSKTEHSNEASLGEHPVGPAQDGKAYLQQAVAEGRRIGVLIVSYRSRECDFDNLALAGKPLIDALRYSGYLADDDPATIEAFYLQRKSTRASEHTDVLMFPL